MPNGVICGGAVEGSNQLGEIVTCHAMTRRPDGAGSAAIAGAAAKRSPAATVTEWAQPRRNFAPSNAIIRLPPVPKVLLLECDFPPIPSNKLHNPRTSRSLSSKFGDARLLPG